MLKAVFEIKVCDVSPFVYSTNKARRPSRLRLVKSSLLE